MPVQVHTAAIRILRVIFEARYDEGYRYLDRCGETLVRIKKKSPAWIPANIDPQRGVVSNLEQQLTLNISNESMIVATNEELDYRGMGKKIEVFGPEAEMLYNTIVETIGAPNTTRVGFRCQFLAPADSVEEANRLMCRAPHSSFLDNLLEKTRFLLRNASMAYVLEDPESGLRKRIELSAVARVAIGGPAPTGLSSDKGGGGIMVDIDTFTRPDQGHFPKLGMFIQQSYLSALDYALWALEWLVRNQK